MLSLLLLVGIGGLLVSSIVPVPYMDEPFHVGQFMQFRNFLFGDTFSWDPAITTFPGLYLVSLFLLAPLLPFLSDLGTAVLALRFVNFFFVNCALFWVGSRISKLTGVLLVLFPLNFFYSFLYYTDNLATVSMLMCGKFHFEKKFKIAGLFGILAVLARQTNIVWLFGLSALHVYDTHRWDRLWIQILTGASFVIFVLYNNGSVVLGHHEHHAFSLHWAQINYFVLAAAPLLLANRKQGYSKMQLVGSWVCFLGFAVWGTVAHPFILSDNRHYSFYFYKRIVDIFFFRISLIPLVCAFVMAKTKYFLNSKSFVFIGCLFATLVPTPLIEFRYFALPCSILILGLPVEKKIQTFLIAAFCVVNFVVMWVFLFRPFNGGDRFMY